MNAAAFGQVDQDACGQLAHIGGRAGHDGVKLAWRGMSSRRGSFRLRGASAG